MTDQSHLDSALSGSGSKSDDEKKVRLLEPGKSIRRELSGANSHAYQIRLSARQFLKVVVEQQGIDVVAQLSGPGGEQIAEFDWEGRSQGQELASLVAEADGAYRLTVRPKQKNAPAGGYEIRIEELRAATEVEPLYQRALAIREKALGFDLFGAGGAGAKRKRRRGDTQLRERPRPGGDPSLKVQVSRSAPTRKAHRSRLYALQARAARHGGARQRQARVSSGRRRAFYDRVEYQRLSLCLSRRE